MRRVAAIGLSIALLSPVLLFAVSPKREAPAPKIYPMTYAVADLPVWRRNLKDTPKFAPEVLVEFIKSTVDPESWKTGAEIRPMERNSALIISQSEANHEAIAKALRSFREQVPGEVEEQRSAEPNGDLQSKATSSKRQEK